MMPATARFWYAIGASDTVGRGEYCNYPAQVQEVEAVKSGRETNLEQIIALKPDVVVMTKMAQSVEHIEALEKAGIPTGDRCPDIADVHAAITLLGQVTGNRRGGKAGGGHDRLL